MGRKATNLEGEALLSEAEVLGGHEAGQKDVDAFPHAEGHCHHPVRARLAVQAAYEIRQVVQHRQVVLHHYDVLSLPQQVPYHLRHHQRPRSTCASPESVLRAHITFAPNNTRHKT